MEIKEVQTEIAKIGAGSQISLFHVEKQTEYEGIVMGVLENGTPYLSETGLAKMCGIKRQVLNTLAANWDQVRDKPRGKLIDKKLREMGYTEPVLFIRCEVNSVPTNAYTEPVCMALLEHYAFDASKTTPEALNAFRKLARLSFRKFVYEGVGYSPEAKYLHNWRFWADRVDIVANAVPEGYYCVFSEIAPIIVPLIQAGLIVTDKVIPDISVGKLWSKYWTDNAYDRKFGQRQQFLHNYPEYYRQALSNPQKAYVYPESSLPVFRAWLRRYVESQFPKYLLDKVKQKALTAENAAAAIEAYKVKATLIEA